MVGESAGINIFVVIERVLGAPVRRMR